MNIINLIKSFKSAERFSDRVVEPEKIKQIIKAVEFSTLGSEKVPLKTLVVTKPGDKYKLRQAAEQVEKAYARGAGNGHNNGDKNWNKPFLEEAPYLVVICSLSGQPYKAATTWLSLGNLMVAAFNEGLGSLCYAPSMPTFLRKVLDIPRSYMPIAIVPIGYPADSLFPSIDEEHEKAMRNLFSGRFRWRRD